MDSRQAPAPLPPPHPASSSPSAGWPSRHWTACFNIISAEILSSELTLSSLAGLEIVSNLQLADNICTLRFRLYYKIAFFTRIFSSCFTNIILNTNSSFNSWSTLTILHSIRSTYICFDYQSHGQGCQELQQNQRWMCWHKHLLQMPRHYSYHDQSQHLYLQLLWLLFQQCHCIFNGFNIFIGITVCQYFLCS